MSTFIGSLLQNLHRQQCHTLIGSTIVMSYSEYSCNCFKIHRNS